MKGYETAGDLKPGDLFVVMLDEEADTYHFSSRHGFGLPTFWRRVVARVVETMEMEGTATEGSVSERNGCTTYVMGEPNEWVIRFFIGEDRFTKQLSGRFPFEVLPPHHPVCIECVEPWPCREQRQESEARRFTAELDNLCEHCGKSIGGAWSISWHDGVTRRRYHQAQKYRGPDGRRCKDAAEEARGRIPGEVNG